MFNCLKVLLIIISSIIAISCSLSSKYIDNTPRNRNLILDNYHVSENDYGGVERWYAVDKYNLGSAAHKVRFQVGYFKENLIGFILYEGGIVGEEVVFSRQGLDLRWDWGSYYRDGSFKFRYSFVIEPDGTGLYYDFSTSKDGTAKARGVYKTYKF